MTALKIPTAAIFEPLLHPSRYKGAYGGRGSGKSHFFGGLSLDDALRIPGERGGAGMRMVCVREVQKSLKESSKRLIEDKLRQFRLGPQQGFKVFDQVIQLPGDGLMVFLGMNTQTETSIKSLEGYDRAWWEEAQTAKQSSLDLLRPTIRAPDSEIWFSWNPNRPTDPIDTMLRGANTPTGSTVVQANWSDNPWLPKELEQERRDCLNNEPEKYDHIWQGGYATVLQGAYYAKLLTLAQLEGRIGFVPRDPLHRTYAFWDIGATGKKSDATAIWIMQMFGTEVRVLNYYEAVGQPFATHVAWLRKHDYDDTVCVLPHDGATHDTVHKTTPESYLRDAGFQVDTVPNQGTGAAMRRIEAARTMFPNVRFNEATTKGGREALGYYHEKQDEARGIGLGPEHDWASHGADAFGLAAVYRPRTTKRNDWNQPLRRNLKGVA